MISQKKLGFTLTAITLALTTLLHPTTLHAQESGDKTITVIPPRFELFANPGDSLTELVRIRNESDFPVTYTIVVEDFSASGEEGHVVLEEEGTETFSLASWIEPETRDIVLQPQEERSFTFSINVPRDAEPGGHYASVLFQSGSDPVPGAANVTQRVGTLVLLRVSGNVTEQAVIETFEAPNYSQSGPVPFTLRLRNDGNTHIRPQGTIIITNLFGQKVQEVPLQGANVLPGAIRKMDQTVWDQENIIGHFTATLVATYGQQNLPLTAATKFTVISPTAIILISVIGVAGLFFLISLISGRSRLLKALKVMVSGD